MSYWVAHLKSNGTVSESILDFDKKAKMLTHGGEEWSFKMSCKDGTIAIIPRENILFAESIEEDEE